MSTPKKGIILAQDSAAATESPGTWRHPRLNEINRRREATTFSEKNARRIAYNLATLLGLWTVQLLVKMYTNPQSFSPAFRLYLGWVWTVFQLIPLFQITTACLPLLRARDELIDIPLTAAQRKLLGLAPAPAPATASSPSSPAASVSSPSVGDPGFSTPPRYSRTPSLAGSVGSRRDSFSHSPLSGRGGGGGGASPAALGSSGDGGIGSGSGRNSPFSSLFETGTTTPLLQRSGGSILGGGNDYQCRLSLGGGGGGGGGSGASGTISPFSGSTTTAVHLLGGGGGDPLSPSPAGGKRTSVGLNSKWLYEKGRRSSGNAWVH